MPRPSVWLIRLALLHLVAAGLLGAWLLMAKGAVVPPVAGGVVAHAAMALIGWLVQMTVGVGYWILPKYAAGPERGPAWAPWATLGLLNGGIVLAALGAWIPGGTGPGLALAGLGLVVFVATAGPRVKAFGADR